MRTNIFRILLISLVLLAMQMMIHASEGKLGAIVDNLFTVGEDQYPQCLTWCSPGNKEHFFTGERTHYGFPCWALYIDISTETPAWYAKLDLFRLAANWLLAVFTATIIVVMRKPKAA